MAESLIDKVRKEYAQHQEFRQEALDLACKELEVPTAQKIVEDLFVINTELTEENTKLKAKLIAVDDVLKFSEQGCWRVVKVSEIRKAIESTKGDVRDENDI